MATTKKTAKTTTKKARRGPKPYTPTQTERNQVLGLISCGITYEVARRFVVNPKTGKPFSKRQFQTIFANELVEAKGRITGRAVATLIEGMDSRTETGRMTREALTASMFWLRTRENEMFSERVINDNRDQSAADELDNLTDEDRLRIADNVRASIKGAGEARTRLKQASIDDEPAGSA